MEQFVTSDFKLGIIAGGQLGKMLIQAASKWDVTTFVLDPDADCPSSSICNQFVEGDFKDFETVYNFGQLVDLLTYEVESINVEALQKLKQEGKRIYPDPDALTIIQDKGLQKAFYRDHNIASAEFELYNSKEDIIAALDNGIIEAPFVQKARKGGYDGRGVAVINTKEDTHKLLDCPSVVERKIDFSKELAVIVNQNTSGDIACFPAVEMEFNPNTNLVEKLICPAFIDEEIKEKATALAKQVIKSYDLYGTLAVELFLDKHNKLWVNEVAPRPHNSGHHTIESVFTSQYEQHLRSILDFPLGSTQLKIPSSMINLLGEPGHEGPVKYEGLEESMAIEGVNVHLYGKKQTRPHRKMGHVTVISSTIEEAMQKADQVMRTLKVKAWKK